MEPDVSLPCPQQPANVQFPRHCVTFRNKVRFYGEDFLVHRPTPNLEDHILSANKVKVKLSPCLFF
jgi:hypothetical protein